MRLIGVLLSLTFLFVSIWAVAAGFGLWEMRPWTWYVFVFASIQIVYLSAFLVTNSGETAYKLPAFLAVTAAVVIALFRVKQEVRVPYFMPRIRWWESNTRFQPSLQAIVRAGDDQQFDAQILDISMLGCFLKTPETVTPDGRVLVQFRMFDREFQISGSAVWSCESGVTHPKGIGVKFDRSVRRYRKSLRSTLKRQAALEASYRFPLDPSAREKALQALRDLQQARAAIENATQERKPAPGSSRKDESIRDALLPS